MTALESTYLLLQLLQRESDPAAWLQEVRNRKASLDDLFVRGLVFGLAPQLAYRLHPLQAELPASAVDKFEAAYVDQEQRNRQIENQLVEILAACAQHGLRPILLKGVHLAFLVYPEPGLRPMNDIDLLFHKEELPVVHQVLGELGYVGRFRDPERGGRIVKHTGSFRRDTDYTRATSPYLKPATDRTVEPHTSLDESWFGLRAAMHPGAMERARITAFRKLPCRVLALEDLVHQLCLHVTFHLLMGQPPWVQYMDLALLAENNDLNWELLEEGVVACGNQRFVWATLCLVRDLLGAPVPATFLEHLLDEIPASVRGRLPRLDLCYVLTMSQRPPMRTFWNRVQRGLVDRREAAQWAAGWGERLRIWRTALEVWKTDTWMERKEL